MEAVYSCMLTKNQIKGYLNLRSKILDVDNSMVETDISECRYQKLIREACNRSTGLTRRLQIRDELKVIRSLRSAEAEKGKFQMRILNNLQPVRDELAVFLSTQFPATKFTIGIEKADGQEYMHVTWENDAIEAEVREMVRCSKFSKIAYILADVTITQDHHKSILAQAEKMNLQPEKYAIGWNAAGAVYKTEYRQMDYRAANKALLQLS